MPARKPSAVEAAAFSFLDGLDDEHVLVAFSGGPDSTALLWSLLRAASPEQRKRISAAHLDHGLDPASGERARAAAEFADRLGLAPERFYSRRLESAPEPGIEGVEAWARRRRYAFLRDVAGTLTGGALDRVVAVTAHHADDQAETVALRLLFGSGLRGLAGIRPTRTVEGLRIVRPLLGVRRADVDAALAVVRSELPELEPVDDPTNFDPDQPRARIRHHVLPELGVDPPLLSGVATASRRFHGRLDAWMSARLRPRQLGRPAGTDQRLRGGRFSPFADPGAAVDLDAFLALPAELRRQALAFLHFRAGSGYPPADAARAELERQLADLDAGGRVGVDCGDSLRWTVRSAVMESGEAWRRELQLRRRIPAHPFTYTFQAPGVVDVPEIFSSLRFEPSEARPWMFRGEVLRAGLALPRGQRPTAEVRSRRPGDRLRPLGAGGSKRLKDLLIDHKVPAELRDRLPLLWLDGILAWVPGVTVDERFRLPGVPTDDASAGRQVWVAEIRTRATDETSDEG